jgi:hypothetical protein
MFGQIFKNCLKVIINTRFKIQLEKTYWCVKVFEKKKAESYD